MPLIADRFLSTSAGSSVDISSGAPVCLHVTNVSEDQQRWADRCAALYRLRHPHLVKLVDYGVVGRIRRFEAFAPYTVRRPADASGGARRALESVTDFLRRLGMSTTGAHCRCVVETSNRLALLPCAEVGLPAVVDDSGASAPTHGPSGMVIQPRSAVRAVVDWLTHDTTSGPRVLCLHGPLGSGLRTTMTCIAREARICGFVPVSSRWFGAHDGAGRFPRWFRELCRERHLVVIHDLSDPDGSRRGIPSLSRVLLGLGRASARRHALLVVSRTGMAGWPAIAIEPMGQEALRRMLMAANITRRMSGAWLDRCIRDADGWPGRLIERVGRQEAPGRDRSRVFAAVAEVSPPYAVSSEGATDSSLASEPLLSNRLNRARQKAVDGCELAARGRHAAAERMLRDSIGALIRRDDREAAGRAAVNLGRLLLSRGRVAAALDAFVLAQRVLERLEAQLTAIGAAVFTGLARVDQGQFEEAEHVLRAAWLAVRQSDGRGLAIATQALARCLLWQGRIDEARRLVASPVDDHRDDMNPHADQVVITAALRARIELAGLDVHAAGLSAHAAIERAAAIGRPLELAIASRASALVHAASGDLDGVRARIRAGLDGAKRAHAPLMAIRLRTVEVRALAAAGRHAEARRVAQPLQRLRVSVLPLPLASLVRLALDEAGTAEPAPRTNRAAAPRARNCALSVAIRHEPLAGVGARPAVIDDVIDVLYLCQRSDDEPAALGRVGGMVRERTRAAGVAFLGMAGDALSVIAASGSQPDEWATALRAVRSGVLIRPSRRDHGVEAAVPIRYGAATLGALACRWTTEGPADVPRAEALISATAVACAPCVQVALDRQSRVARIVAGELRVLGTSRAADELRHATARAAAAPFPVLVEGESGSGKELVARAIHGLSPRRSQRFCAVNCAALPDELVESELFGHARGAFTGAMAPRLGLFEEANGGTLFLDEISELSARAQAKLLRVLQEGEIRRIGENGARRVDVRIVAATNRTLTGEVEAGRFRRDLLYRLDVVRIVVPPLRGRIEDIPVLAIHFWEQACATIGSRASLSSTTLAALARYDWPGNVRELQNAMAALAVSMPRRGSVGPSALPATIGRLVEAKSGATLEEARRSFEERFVRAALARAGGHRGRAARELGVSRQGLVKLLARLDLGGKALP